MKKAVSVLISVIIGLALINGLAFSAISSTREQARIAAGFDFSEQGVHGDYIYGELKGHLLSATSDYTVTFNGILGLDVIDGRITETSTTNITTGVINWLDSNGRKIATSSITFGTPVLITYPVPDISITISNSATTINRVTGNFKIYQSKNNVTEVSAAEMLAVMKQVSANIKLTNDRLDFISANILADTAVLTKINKPYQYIGVSTLVAGTTATKYTFTRSGKLEVGSIHSTRNAYCSLVGTPNASIGSTGGFMVPALQVRQSLGNVVTGNSIWAVANGANCTLNIALLVPTTNHF